MIIHTVLTECDIEKFKLRYGLSEDPAQFRAVIVNGAVYLHVIDESKIKGKDIVIEAPDMPKSKQEEAMEIIELLSPDAKTEDKAAAADKLLKLIERKES